MNKIKTKRNDLSPEKILEIFKDYTPLIKKASNQNHLRAFREDAFATANYALLKAIRNYDEEKGVPFAGYAKKIVYGEMWTLFKKEKRKWTHEFIPQYVNEDGKNDFFENLSASDTLGRLDMHTSLKKALKELSDEERVLLKSIYLDELTQSEIAKRRGVTQQAIAKKKKSILKKMRQMLS